MRRVNRWRAPRWFRWWMLLATRAGDGWLWGAIGIAVLLSSAPRALSRPRSRRLRRHGRHPDFSPDQTRRRPHAAARYRAALLGAHRHSGPVFVPVGAFDYGVRGGAVAGLVLSGSKCRLLLMLAANVAISRVIVGMHFLSDVLVGSGMGALLGYVAFKLAT